MLAIIAVVLRLYARFKLAKRPGWDDALVVLSLVRRINTHKIFANARLARLPQPLVAYFFAWVRASFACFLP